MSNAALNITLDNDDDLATVLDALREGGTTRLPIDWPKELKGEQDLEVVVPGDGPPLRLRVKRAGGRVTEEGLRVRLTAADETEAERLADLLASTAEEDAPSPATAERPPDEPPAEQEPDEQEPDEQEPDEQEPDEQEPDEQEPDEQEPDEQPQDQEPEDDAPRISVRPASDFPLEALEGEVEDATGATPAEIARAAERVIADEMETSNRATVVKAGAAGALALCRARITAEATPMGRSRFLRTMRELGQDALPAIMTTIDEAQAIVAGDEGHDALEDLLRAMPKGEHEELARRVAHLCTHPGARIRQAALTALLRLRGERAKPELRHALRDDDEAVCGTAIDGLRRIRGIDMLAMHRLDTILSGDAGASDELRAVAATALIDVEDSQRDAAVAALRQTLHPRTSIIDIFVKRDELDPLLVESICRTLLAIGDVKDRRMVEKRAAKSRYPLKQRLEALLEE